MRPLWTMLWMSACILPEFEPADTAVPEVIVEIVEVEVPMDCEDLPSAWNAGCAAGDETGMARGLLDGELCLSASPASGESWSGTPGWWWAAYTAAYNECRNWAYVEWYAWASADCAW